MPLRGALEDARLTLAFLPLVARTRWQLWRVPVASSSAAWRERATRELDAARARNAAPLVPFEVWRRAHAVKRAARLIPGATCLTQALSLQSILSNCGENTSLILGVDKNSKPGAKINFEAHAWIEWNGRVIIGGPIDRWKPLLTIAPPANPTPATDSSKLANASSPAQ